MFDFVLLTTGVVGFIYLVRVVIDCTDQLVVVVIPARGTVEHQVSRLEEIERSVTWMPVLIL